MAFVHVKTLRLDPERIERPHAADSEHDLLTHSHFLIAAIELGSDETIFGVVFRRVGVEKKQADPPDLKLPDFRKDLAVEDSNGNHQVGSVALHLANRQMMKILIETDRLLRAVLVDLLPEIAVAIKQSNRDEV